jgi:hypothetical protein
VLFAQDYLLNSPNVLGLPRNGIAGFWLTQSEELVKHLTLRLVNLSHSKEMPTMPSAMAGDRRKLLLGQVCSASNATVMLSLSSYL